MKTIAKTVIKILGWKTISNFPDIDKSVIIFAPHTSYWDGFFGKLFLMQLTINYKFLSKKALFKFPLNIFMTAFGSIPVSRNKEYIDEIVELFDKNDNLHIIMSPEGQRGKTDHWKKGFYYMANKSNVPITIAYIDYKQKEIGIKGIIKDTTNMKQTMIEVNRIYKEVNAKHPDSFATDKRFS